jgi:hypothetical protein
MNMGVARSFERIGLSGVAERLRSLRWWWETVRLALAPRHAARLTALWAREPIGRRGYRVLSEHEVLGTRRSETAFVFGSGASLLDIGADEWEEISHCDVVGFSHFHRQRWVRVDYHLVYEVASVTETAASIRANPLYSETIFGMGKGWLAEASNELVAGRMLPPHARIFRWRRIARGRLAPASTRLSRGLVHGAGSIQDAVNFALVMGWRRIVIAGVDLHGGRHFWTPETGSGELARRWAQADTVIPALRQWREAAVTDGVELLVFDGNSVLAEALPAFRH